MVATSDRPGSRSTSMWRLLPLLVLGLVALSAGEAWADDKHRLTVHYGGPLRQVEIKKGDQTDRCGAHDYSAGGTWCWRDYEAAHVFVGGQPERLIWPTLELTASTSPTTVGWAFRSWSGACTGSSPTCSVSMDENREVFANFMDVVRPRITLRDPGAAVSGTKALSAVAIDDESGVSKVEFRATGTDDVTRLFTATTPAPLFTCGFIRCYKVDWDTTAFPDGPVEIRATAYDRAEETGAPGPGITQSAARTVMVDNTPPVPAITSPSADGSTTTATTMTLAFTATEAATFACRTYRAGAPPPDFAACSAAASHTVSGLTPGTQAFDVRATDALGNSAVATRSWTVVAPGSPPPPPDTTAPSWRFSAASKQRAARSRAIVFKVRPNERCTLTATAKLGRRSLGKLTRSLAANRTAKLKLKLSRKGVAALKKGLRKKRVAKIKLVMSCVDGAGNRRLITRGLKVRR